MTEPPWHRYVFDSEERRFVGDFEAMYQAEAQGQWDAWHQSDPRRLDNRVAMLLLDQVTYSSAVDLGSGKGAFTASLKRRDNRVVGVDASETAIAAARAHHPDVEWVCASVDDYVSTAEPVDLFLLRELLSYLDDWRELLAGCAERCRYCLVSLYLPLDPIGFVKSHEELEVELARHFESLESVALQTRGIRVHLLESRLTDATPARRGP